MRTAFDDMKNEDGWTVRTLGDVSEIVGGMQKTPARSPLKLHKPYLTVRNVQHGYLDLNALARFEVSEDEFDRLRLIRGDLLIVEGNGSLDHIGRNALYEGDPPDCVHQNHIIRVRPSLADLLPEFVSLYLNSPQGRAQMVERAETSSGLYSLGAGKVASLQVPTPSLNEQHRLVSLLSSRKRTAEAMNVSLEAQVVAIARLPEAILGQAFAGGI